MEKQFNWLAECHPIRLRREGLSISLRNLAKATGLDFTSISRIENGYTSVWLRDVPGLAKALEMDFFYLCRALTQWETLAKHCVPTKEDCFDFAAAVLTRPDDADTLLTRLRSVVAEPEGKRDGD